MSVIRQPAYYRGPWIERPDGTVMKEAVDLPFFPLLPYEPDPLASPAENERAAKRYDEEQKKGVQKVKKALRVVSQTPTGRYVLESAKKMGFRIAMRPDLFSDDDETGAVCDVEGLAIVLNPAHSVLDFVMHLHHECAHARLGDLVSIERLNEMKLPAQIQSLRFLEADAYAFEVQAAYELMMGDKALGYAGAHPRQVRFPHYLRDLASDPDRRETIAAFMTRVHQGGATDGHALAAAHKAFYRQSETLAFYDEQLVDEMGAFTKRISAYARRGKTPQAQQERILDIAESGAFAQTQTLKELQTQVSWRGKAYISQFNRDEDYTDAFHTAVDPKTFKKLETRANRFGVPPTGIDKVPVRQMPLPPRRVRLVQKWMRMAPRP